ncbi:MAG: hypothetical protein JW965_01435 [Bacteroidales bacterium]|nr:hypothetical protein [Bacteroidales bacterium]
MKRALFLTYIFSLLYLPITSAQLYWGNIDEHMAYLRRERLVSDFNPKAYENIGGTPYLVKEYEEGKVYLMTGEVLNGEFRFDLYADAIQFINEGNRYVLAYPQRITKIELNGNVLKYIDYKIDAGIDYGYFIELVEGYSSLYLRKSKTLTDPVSTRPYQQARPARFIDHKDYYYIKIGENPAQRVRNKKELIKLFGDEATKAETYIKNERINVKNEYDLVKLVTQMNELLVE